MILDPHTRYPSGRSFVLKLHRDASPARGALRGRLEHISSGQSCDFGSGDELLACLSRELAKASE